MEKDKKGRTQVHVIGCEHLGKLGIFPCSCPCRLSAETVQLIQFFKILVGVIAGMRKVEVVTHLLVGRCISI